jgi:drug/metabolite transporter (DMT)-like permease
MWYWASIGAATSLAIMVLILRKLQTVGVSNNLILVFLFGFGCLLYLGQAVIGKVSLNPGRRCVVFGVLIAAVFSYLGNLLQLKAMESATNPGYVAAIIGCQAVIISVGAIYLFGSEFKFYNLCGLVLCVLGVLLLGLRY